MDSHASIIRNIDTTIEWQQYRCSVECRRWRTECSAKFNCKSVLRFKFFSWKNCKDVAEFSITCYHTGAAIACVKGTITYSIPLPLISNGTYTWSVVPATAGNIISANGTNQITIQWVSNAITPIKVKLKISRCYEDSVLLPVTLNSLPAVPNI